MDRDERDLIDEMNTLNPGEFRITINNDVKYLHIVAEIVSVQQVKYTCPFCWSKYKKDGTPYKNATQLSHCHGSEFNVNNKVHPRSAHCDTRGSTIKCDEVKIYVTDKTRRM